jgi:hypothetical protein
MSERPERRRARQRPIDPNKPMPIYRGRAADEINVEAEDVHVDEKEVVVPDGMSLSEASVRRFVVIAQFLAWCTCVSNTNDDVFGG